MTLRKRLFLTIGSLFFIAFIVSFYLENFLTNTHLVEAEKNLEENIERINEKKRQSIENYLVMNLAIIQARNRAVLDRIKDNPLLRKGFIQRAKREPEESWLNSSTLLITNKILDLVEALDDSTKKLESLIIVNPEANTYVDLIENFEDFSLLAVWNAETKEWEGPFIGIPLELDEVSQFDSQTTYTWKHIPEFWAFFYPQAILDFDADVINRLHLFINPIEPFLNWHVVPDESGSVKKIVLKIERVKEKILKNPEMASRNSPSWKQWEKKRKPLPLKGKDYFVGMDFKGEVKSLENKELNKLDQIGMIWGYSSLLAGGAFGNTPFDKRAPIGIAQIETGFSRGKGVFIRDVFRQNPLKMINGKEYDYALTSREESRQKLTVFLSPIEEKIYLGNSIEFSDPDFPENSKQLTSAVDGDQILQQLSLVTNQMTVFISGDQVISVFDANGSKNKEKTWFQLPVEKIKKENTGTIDISGTPYYFLHMTPIEGLDFHFFIFNPEDKEFALINNLKTNTSNLIKTISFHMRFAALGALVLTLLILNKIAKRITRPIAHLAKVTDAVGKGKLEDIEFPELSKKPTDEVYKLYHAFSDMVQGLKEKEKVRGVLNKVVSQEIAEEILKKSISLGGEEKTVTVLFADIRNFSGITEKMDPKNVIKMLNNCMTIVSEKIDEYGGVIDKYVGDEVMALFGAPIEKPDSALQAIKCALAFLHSLEQWNQDRKAKQLAPIHMGVGIHTGLVVCGNMGAQNRLNYTVLGANVNLSARLCDTAEANQILISQDTLEQEHVQESVVYEALEPITPKGFTHAVNVYNVKELKS
ncbi:MAG: hypothetical protein Tsb0015_17230 [Simkaniaceae bacterium]